MEELREESVPSDPSVLKQRIQQVEDLIRQIREEMDRFYEIAPRVKKYHDLHDAEMYENEYHWIEDPRTGDEISASRLVWDSFDKQDKKIWSSVCKFRHPLFNLEGLLKKLRFAAAEQGVILASESQTPPSDKLGEPTPPESKETSRREPQFKFDSPGLRWGSQITMTLIGEESIKIRAGEKVEKRFIQQIGLVNNNTGRPNYTWEVLRCFAANGGRIPKKNDLPGRSASELPTWITKLRKHLDGLTDLEGDTIPKIQRGGHYQVVFKIEWQGYKPP